MGRKNPLIISTDKGLYCEAGGFYIDPLKKVERAVITHAHSDHARSGSKAYLCSASGEGVLRERIGKEAQVETLAYGDTVEMNGVRVSLHPAGHLLGSAQVRMEYQGQVWVVSGDYKTQRDASCEAFEPVKCGTFITESTFALPVYRWPAAETVFDEINNWWQANRDEGRTSVIFAYALGKAQRVLAGVDASIGPILVHGSVNRFLPHYHKAGFALNPAEHAHADNIKEVKGCGLVIAPGSTQGTPWLRKFGPASTAFASGWMRIRGTRRRQALDRGFILSDHADWDGLIDTIRATGAESVGVTHGYVDTFVRWLKEEGWSAFEVKAGFRNGEEES